MKVWAASADDAGEFVGAIAPRLGAEVHGRVEVYSSEPAEPPQDEPFAYDPSLHRLRGLRRIGGQPRVRPRLAPRLLLLARQERLEAAGAARPEPLTPSGP